MSASTLRNQRVTLVYEAVKMMDHSSNSYRDFNETEENQYNELLSEIDRLGAAIGDGLSSRMGIKTLEKVLFN
jgi:hypothetical protein